MFAVVVAAQLALVAAAGTDVPFHDQWDVEGRWLYPRWFAGEWQWTDLFRAHNEHRIAWTHATNLLLVALNGQWDPLVQLALGAVLRAAVAAVLFDSLVHAGLALPARWVAAGVGLAFLPHLAWHNALWGFQSQVYWALLFGVLTVRFWTGPAGPGRRIAGLATAAAALMAMGPGALVPLAVLIVIAVRMLVAPRRLGLELAPAAGAVGVLVAAWFMRADVPEHAVLQARGLGEFLPAFGRMLAWPHTAQPWAAVVLNVPLALLVFARVSRRRSPAPGEDFVFTLGLWAILVAAAAAWTRGGGPEFAAGVPSRYADFMVLLPLANAASLGLIVTAPAANAARWRLAAGIWAAFLVLGWTGLSVETTRRVLLPRIRDREAPVRLAVAFQRTGDEAVFAGQPRLLVPHPHPASVRSVLADPRLRGRLPPSFQPEDAPGPLSRAVRSVLGRREAQ